MNYKLLVKSIGVGIGITVGVIGIMAGMIFLHNYTPEMPRYIAAVLVGGGCFFTVVGVTAMEYYNIHKDK